MGNSFHLLTYIPDSTSRIPLLNKFSLACEVPLVSASTERYRSTDVSDSFSEMALALEKYGERVTELGEIVPAIHRGIEKTREGKLARLEFITARETEVSKA